MIMTGIITNTFSDRLIGTKRSQDTPQQPQTTNAKINNNKANPFKKYQDYHKIDIRKTKFRDSSLISDSCIFSSVLLAVRADNVSGNGSTSVI